MISCLQHIIEYIDEHRREPLDLDQIAGRIGYSKYYLNHLFRVYTGFSIMEYARRKKLEAALDELKAERRLLDVALDFGYSSERALSRAIRNEFGHPPTFFRTHKPLPLRDLRIYDRRLELDPQRILDGFPGSFHQVRQQIEQKGFGHMKDYLSEVRYEVIPTMTVLSGTSIGAEPEDAIIQQMARLTAALGINVLRSFGFDSPVEESEDMTSLRGYEYWLSVESSELQKLSDPRSFDFEGTAIHVKEIPGYRYAVLRVIEPFADPFERIGTGWRVLVNWLEDHDFKEADFHLCPDAPCLEEVIVIEGKTCMDLFIPVDVI